MARALRLLTPSDEPALWEMLYHAIHVPPGAVQPPRTIVQQPELARYVAGWGRPDDLGFLALDAAGQPVGAAWLRLLTGDARGYGYVDDCTPELSVALLPGHRGRGLGTRLLERLLDAAQERFQIISLSVSMDNPALRLYKRLGFRSAGVQGTSLTMVKTLR